MEFWLWAAGAIDNVNETVGRAARWTLLANALLVAGNGETKSERQRQGQ